MAINMFWKFTEPELIGGSLMKGHETWQEIISWSHSWDQPTNPVRSSAGGGTIERAHHGTLNFTMELDSAFDDMQKMLWTGQHIDKGQLVCYRAAGDTGANQMGIPYLKIDLESMIITHLSISASPGELPIVNFSLNYAKVTYTYNQQDHTQGTVGADTPVSHDLRTNVVE